MSILLLLGYGLLLTALVGMAVLFVLYPLALGLAAVVKTAREIPQTGFSPSVSVIVVARNAGAVLGEKIRATLALDYPADRLDLVIYADGADPVMAAAAAPFVGERVCYLETATHEGKNRVLNLAVAVSRGDVLVFSDVDTRLDRRAVRELVHCLADPHTGGVCGRRMVTKGGAALEEAQERYTDLDNAIKRLESRVGSISSNAGTLYAIRRGLFRPIPPGVTDDLYLCLAVVGQHRPFVYAEAARAYMQAPSRDPVHELQRRRRIVCCSLTGIRLMREVLNPFHHGFFAVELFVNKIMRRLLPLFLILFLAGSLALAPAILWARLLIGLQAAFYGLALMYGLARGNRWPRVIRRVGAMAFYFCIGNCGVLMGLSDYLRGRQVTRWEPVKESPSAQ